MWLAVFFNSEENIETTTIKHRDENEETKKWKCGWKRKKSILYTHESSSWEFRQIININSIPCTCIRCAHLIYKYKVIHTLNELLHITTYIRFNIIFHPFRKPHPSWIKIHNKWKQPRRRHIRCMNKFFKVQMILENVSEFWEQRCFNFVTLKIIIFISLTNTRVQVLRICNE